MAEPPAMAYEDVVYMNIMSVVPHSLSPSHQKILRAEIVRASFDVRGAVEKI